MARLDRDWELRLRDGRVVLVTTARPSDAADLTHLLDAIASEPGNGLLITPGQARARDWRARITETLSQPRSVMLMAHVDGRLVGNLGLRPDPHPCSRHVSWVGMSVARGHRSLGVGAALLAVAKHWAAGAGFERLVLGVFPENTRAIAFYEREGFVREGQRHRQYRRGDQYHDEVLMARSLFDEPPRPAPVRDGAV
jgi:putative acetyltransferase